MKRPIGVMRGSPSEDSCGPAFSASVYIVRNLMILKHFPSRPTRSCKKKIGPEEESLTAIAEKIKNGMRQMSAKKGVEAHSQETKSLKATKCSTGYHMIVMPSQSQKRHLCHVTEERNESRVRV